MSNLDNELNRKQSDASAEAERNAVPASASRRKIFRKIGLVAVPVVATLASRPVLAWHCRTPSMWGSLVMNPNTSLRTNDGHQTGYKDENWSIAGWRSNSIRSATGVLDRPWAYLLSSGVNKAAFLRASLVNASTGSGNTVRYVPYSSTPTRYLDTQIVTVNELVGATGIILPAGVLGSSKVYDVLNSSSFGAHLLVAQLNFRLLFPLKSNLMELCFNLGDLQQMATGFYSPTNNINWGQQEIVDYLQNNWVVLPTDSFDPTGSKKYFKFSIYSNNQP